MLRVLIRYAWLFLLFPMLVSAQDNPPLFQINKDYEIIPVTTTVVVPPKNKIQVEEFFSYGCPACYHFEPALETWLKNKPADVTFARIPVVFETNWDTLARVYYTAKDLGIAEKISHDVFDAVQKQGQDLANKTTLEQFFAAHGINQKDFNSAFNFSPGIDAQLMRGDNLMRAYNIYQVPTIVVNGIYKTNPSLAHGDNTRLLQIVDYLINLERLKQSGMKK